METFDFRQLRAAVEVFRLGSLTKAAASLYIAQPNLSRSITELERDLGFRLFIRTKKGMLPTSEGACFLSEAETLLTRLSETAEALRREKKRRCHFSSVPSSLYVNIILSASRHFKDSLNIQCQEFGDCREVFSNVVSETSEAAFLLIGKQMSEEITEYCRKRGLEYHWIGESPAYLIVSPESRVCKTNGGTPEICFSETLLMMNLDYFDSIGIRYRNAPYSIPPVKGICRGAGRAGNLDMLANIDNLVMLSSHTYSRTLRQHNLIAVPFHPEIPLYEYGYIMKKGRRLSPETSAVLDRILEDFRKEMAVY